MNNPETRTTDQVIETVINNVTSNTLNAVFSVIESYKELILKAESTDAYDAGKRDAIQELTVHLRKLAQGITKTGDAQ
jgi:hypothetical protein